MVSQPSAIETPTPLKNDSHSARYVWIAGLVITIAFTLLIWLMGPNLEQFLNVLGPDQGSDWYYWQLPVRESWAMLIVWACYIAHQFSIWGLIFWAQKNLTQQKILPTNSLTKYNYAALSLTVAFILLHLLQTQLWFDGLAQDVPIITSQGSVIIMLAMILIIENPRRGLFMRRKAGKPFTASVSAFFRRNHMYIFAWAMIYTFWFHPMASDPQLLSGFFYMFLLFTQLSLAYTRVHLDKRWIITLESYVAIHAVIVAVYNTISFGSADMWPMFFSGFAFMFVFTYMYALNVKKQVLWLITALYIIFLFWLYLPAPIGFGRNPLSLLRLEMLWIPAVLYGLAGLFAVVAYLAKKKR